MVMAKIVSGKRFMFIISLNAWGDPLRSLLSLSHFPHFYRGGPGESGRRTDSARSARGKVTGKA